jgi:sporulation protein YlmC with PRC-barrel domain
MTSFSPDDVRSFYGRQAFDQAGIEIGEIEAVYLDNRTSRPEWAAVRTGRTETSLAPLAGAEITEAGVRLPVDHRLVQRAPVGDDRGRFPEQLSAEQEAELYHYYSIDYATGPSVAEGGSRPRLTLAERASETFGEGSS